MKRTRKILSFVFVTVLLASLLCLFMVSASAATVATRDFDTDTSDVVLAAGDSLEYTDKSDKTTTIKNTFGVELTWKWHEGEDRYVLGTASVSTNDVEKTYDGTPFTAEQLIPAQGTEGAWTYSVNAYNAAQFTTVFSNWASKEATKNAVNVAKSVVNAADYQIMMIVPGATPVDVTAYFVVTEKWGTLTINPAEINVTANGVATGNLTYDYTQAQGAPIDGVADGYNGFNAWTIKYGTVEGTYDLDTYPTFQNAGTYTVYYSVTGDTNYKEATGSYTVVIDKKDISSMTIEFKQQTITYTGTWNAFILDFDTVSFGGDTYFEENAHWLLDNPHDSQMDVGNYTLTVTVLEKWNSNYTGSASFPYYLVKAETNNADVTVDTWTYKDDSTGKVTATFDFGTPVITFATAEDGEYTATIPTLAGTYWVKATVAGTDNYVGNEVKTSFTIAKAVWAGEAPTLTQNVTLTYNGAEQTVTADVNNTVDEAYLASSVITYIQKDACSGLLVNATLDYANYESITVEWAITIAKYAIEITMDSANLTYTGKEQTVPGWTMTSGTPQGEDTAAGVFELLGTTVFQYITELDEGKAYQTFENRARYNHDDNYAITVVPGVVTLAPVKLTMTLDTQSNTYVYDGQSHTFVVSYSGIPVGAVNGDVVAIDSTTASATLTNVGKITAQEFLALKAQALDGTDVALCYVLDVKGDASLEITQRPITLKPVDYTATYGDTTFTKDYETAAGSEYDWVSGETLQGEWDVTCEFSVVGTYAMVLTVDAEANPNYAITVTTGELEVIKKAVNLTINGGSIVYGDTFDTVHGFGWTAEGLVGEDTLDIGFVTTYKPSEGDGVGTYYIVAGWNEVINSNYYFANPETSAVLTVIPKTITITSKTEILYYTGDAYLRDNIFGMDDLTIAGLVGDDTLDLGNFTFAATDPTEFVGSINTVESTTLTLTFTNKNYVIEDNTLTWTVTVQSADIKVVFDSVTYNSKDYDFYDLTYTVYVDGKPVALTLEYYSGKYNDYEAGTYDVTVRVITDGAYKNCQATATWTINPYVISDADDISWTIGNYTYNGKVQGPTASLTIHNKTVFFNVSTEIYVGEHEAYILGISDINGAQTGVANYKLDKFSIPTAFFEIKEAADVKFQSASVVIGEDYAVKFYVVAEAIDQYGPNANFSVVIAGPNGDVTVTRDDLVKVGNRYAFSYDAIGPHQMGELLTATLTVADKTDDRDYSIEQYCYNQLVKNAADTEFTTVIVAMLKYGAEAQKFMNANVADADLVTDALYNDGAYAAFVNVDTKKAEYVNSQAAYRDNINVTGHSITAALNNTAAIRYSATMANIDTMDYTVEVVKNGKVVKTFTEADFAYNTSNGRYYIDFVVGLTGAGDAYTFVVKADGALAAEVTYSIETYANKNSSNAFVTTFADFSALLAAYLY